MCARRFVFYMCILNRLLYGGSMDILTTCFSFQRLLLLKGELRSAHRGGHSNRWQLGVDCSDIHGHVAGTTFPTAKIIGPRCLHLDIWLLPGCAIGLSVNRVSIGINQLNGRRKVGAGVGLKTWDFATGDWSCSHPDSWIQVNLS